MVYVIGSGPAGVSCAVALLNQGIQVTMLDGGQELETERKELIQSLQQRPEHEWNDELLQPFKENTYVDTHGVPLKLAYGSDFPYKSIEFLQKWFWLRMYVSIQLVGQKIEFTDKSIMAKKQQPFQNFIFVDFLSTNTIFSKF